MKVLIISDNPQTNTGYGKLTRAWGKHFVNQGHEVLIMGGVNPNAQIPFKEIDLEGMRVWPVPGYGNAEHVRYFLANEKPDVVIANADPRFFEYLFKMDNEVRRECPLVFYHLWDDDPFPIYNLPDYLSCDKIICGSKFTYDLLKSNDELASRKLLDYVPIGINLNTYKPLPQNERDEFRKEFDDFTNKRFVNAKFIVGAIGRHAERKQLLSILKSFHNWSRDKDDVALFLHSPGSDAGGALGYAMKTLYSDSKIIYSNSAPAAQTDELINKFYNLFDVLVNRSHAEGFGLPICEAMAAGTPCISIDTAGPQNLIKPDNGWLLEADCKPLFGNQPTPFIHLRYVTDAKFEGALDAAYSDAKARESKASKCRTYIETNYNEAQMVRQMETAIKSAINSWTPYPDYTLTSWPNNSGKSKDMKELLSNENDETRK